LTVKENLHISVLSNYIDTVKALQKIIYGSIDEPKNLLIETVARIQGLTTDVTIFVIPNSGYNHSLEKRLFNVATSRAKRHTIIISDKNIISSYPYLDEDVKMYLQKLNDEYSFYYTTEKKLIESKTTEIKETQVEEKPENQPGLKVLGKIDLSKFEKPKKEIKKDKENIYIIDTNVFVDCPDIISKIDKQYQVILSAKVIDELDYLKISLTEEQRKNVQKALKQINESIDKRNIKMDTADLALLPNDFNKKSPDNFILSVALRYKSENPIMLTSDNGMQIKAKGLGITTITLKAFLNQGKY
jgi:rRNA-processing protein FCF1